MVRLVILMLGVAFCKAEEVPAAKKFILADQGEDMGNWYEKLQWWEKAKTVYTGDIQDLVELLDALDKDYLTLKDEIVKEQDDYWKSKSMTAASLLSVVDGILEDLHKRRDLISLELTKPQARKGLSEESDQIEVQQKMLIQLRADGEGLQTIVDRINEAFIRIARRQFDDVKRYVDRAKIAYESIDDTLDDKKAQELYRQIENCLENMRAISAYLRGPLWGFLCQAREAMNRLMGTVTQGIKDLDGKGIVVRVLTPDEKAREAAAEKKRKEEQAKRAAEKKAEEEYRALPWWRKALLYMRDFFWTLYGYAKRNKRNSFSLS